MCVPSSFVISNILLLSFFSLLFFSFFVKLFSCIYFLRISYMSISMDLPLEAVPKCMSMCRKLRNKRYRLYSKDHFNLHTNSSLISSNMMTLSFGLRCFVLSDREKKRDRTTVHEILNVQLGIDLNNCDNSIDRAPNIKREWNINKSTKKHRCFSSVFMCTRTSIIVYECNMSYRWNWSVDHSFVYLGSLSASSSYILSIQLMFVVNLCY